MRARVAVAVLALVRLSPAAVRWRAYRVIEVVEQRMCRVAPDR